MGTNHHNSWRAKATLTTVANSKSLLDSMRILHISNAFNGNDVLSIHTYQGSQTGVNRGVIDFLGSWIDVGDYLLGL